MRQKSKSLMQSEVFVILMVIIILLYIITTIYASILEKNISELTNENIILKDRNKTSKEKNQKIITQTLIIDKLTEKITNQIAIINKLYKNNKIKDEKIISQKIIIDELKLKNKSLIKKYKDLNITYYTQKERFKKHQKPPLITLSEDKAEFRFKVGKARLTERYKNALLSEKFPELINNITKYDCDTIEIYGYTDTLSFNENNIDDKLHNCINNDCEIDKINIKSNLALGMKRAISIVHFLKKQQEQGNINPNIVIKPYSAGQFIDENGKVSTISKNNNKKRRRIEIRISRTKK